MMVRLQADISNKVHLLVFRRLEVYTVPPSKNMPLQMCEWTKQHMEPIEWRASPPGPCSPSSERNPGFGLGGGALWFIMGSSWVHQTQDLSILGILDVQL